MSLRTNVVRATAATVLAGSALLIGTAPAIAATTRATTPSAGWSVTDANGTYRGSVTADPYTSNVCDTLADGVTVSVEAQLSDGTTVKRIAPLGGCTAFQPFNGATITAVRGFANDFANEWHPVA
jgi:hypothetical protein